MLICPDHPTPIATMTHCADPVPYVLYKSDIKVTGVDSYSERNAESTGVFVQSGVELSKRFFNK